MGRQHQGMDRLGVRQVPEGGGEHRKVEETGCEIICGAPTTHVVKGHVKVKEEEEILSMIISLCCSFPR